MPFSLFDDLKRSGFHSSVLTTFSVDPAFYDANVQYRLRAFDCQNNLLMADAAMLSRALEQMPEAFIHAGRKYLIVPIPGQGCFHPKIALRYGKSRARLIIGSANVTSAGWGSNREILSALEWSHTSDAPDNQAQLGLIAKAHDWLMARMPHRSDTDLAYKLDLLASQSGWLGDAERSGGTQAFSDGTDMDLLLSDPDAASGLGSQFVARVGGEVERLVVISPYWDDGLAALRQLHAAFGNPPTHVFMAVSDDEQMRQSTFPVGMLDDGLRLEFHALSKGNVHRFLHAKVVMAQTRSHDYLIYGSANCTIGALGTPAAPGINTEAVIFRRFPRGTIDRQLELDYGAKLKAGDIGEPEEQGSQQAGSVPFDPGKIVRRDTKLIWSCPEGIAAAGSSLLTADQRLAVDTAGGARPFAVIGKELTEASIIVRVELADGRISRPVIVSDPEMLVAAAPNPLASNLKRKLDAVLSGDSDLINLARDIHLIFDDSDAGPRSIAKSASHSRSSSISTATGRDYETPEAFRRALGLKADLYARSFAHADSPALQLILKIVLRGIVDLQDSDSIERTDARAAEALAAGEEQDDLGVGDNTQPPAPRPTLLGMEPSAPIPLGAFNGNRTSLVGAIGRFEDHIENLRTFEAPVDLNFVTRALFMIYLMLYGCTRQYEIEEGGAQVLIPFSGIGTGQQQDGFLLRAARIVSGIWGPRFRDSLMGRISLDREHANLPTPILTLIVLSRWILAAILSEARAVASAKSLCGILEGQIPKLFMATSAFADIDPLQIATAIAQMEKNIGMEKLQADAIRTVLHELESQGR